MEKTDQVPNVESSPGAGAEERVAPAPLKGLADALSALRASDPGCLLAGYGDLGAQLVLRVDPAGARPQEALDELCAQACVAYRMVADAGLGAGHEPVIALVPGETRLFLRNGTGEAADEAALVVCDGIGAAERLGPAVQDILQQLSEDGGAPDPLARPPRGR